MADNEFLTGYLSGQSENRGGGGFFGGEGIWAFLIFAMLAGGFGGGWGFGGGGGGGAGMQGVATRADINAGFQFQDLQNGIRGLTNGLSDSTYALNNTLMNGFHGVDRGLCDLSHQLSDCCCENRAAIADLKYTVATEECQTRNQMQTNTRDIIDSQNAGTRAILDFLTQDKISALQAENQALKFQASQSAQNAFITANQEAQTAELIRRLRTPEAVPAYVVPNPNCCYGNPLGVGYGYGYGNGCGCAV